MSGVRGALGAIGVFALAVLTARSADLPVDASLRLGNAQSNYLLGCGGCHGTDGHSNSKLVPDLKDQVGYFLSIPAGRDYLVRLPNVAFYTASNQELAAMLNYMVFELGGTGVPNGAKPYTAGEVAKLRKTPLTEVSLVAFRARLVDELIAQHHAPESLRTYGYSSYMP
jgi:mono/diheme cytochrome c family protein